MGIKNEMDSLNKNEKIVIMCFILWCECSKMVVIYTVLHKKEQIVISILD